MSIDEIVKFYKYSILFSNNQIYSSDFIINYETKKSFIWLINPNEIEINFNKLERLDNINNYVHEIDGIWACIIKDKNKNEYRAITSIHNELAWYYSNEKKGLLANNIFLLAKYLDNIKLNLTAISSFISFDFSYAGETFLQNVNKSYGGDILYFNEKGIIIKSCDLQKWLGFDNSITNDKVILDAFLNSVSNSLNNKNTQISLTGGADSRAILGAALASGKTFSLMTHSSSSVDKRDIAVPKTISKLINKDHFSIDANGIELDDLNLALREMAIKTSCEFTPRNWLIFYKENLISTNNLNKITRIQGYRGEFFKGFYKGTPSGFLPYIKRHNYFLNEKHKKLLEDLITEQYLLYEKIDRTNANDLFYQRERDNFWVSCNIKTRLNYYKIFTPFADNHLLSLAYRFKGGIRNTGLHHNAIRLLPENVRNISTSSTRLSWIYYNIKKRYFKQKFYNSYLNPDFINKNIDYDLLATIIPEKILKKLLNDYSTKRLNTDIIHKMFAVSYFNELINDL
jgi:hypothetical protein